MAQYTRKRSGFLPLVWGFATIFSVAVAFFAVSIPEAAAQSGKASSADSRQYAQLLQNIYQFVVQNYVDEIDPTKLYQGAMKGMFDSLGDPHSVFLDSAMLSDMMRETDGTYAGVGLYISKSGVTAEGGEPVYVEVVSPIEDSPAWKSRIQPGDIILKIDGESTSSLTVDEASAKIRGPEGTTVTLGFRRGSSYEFEVTFTRAIISIPPIKTDTITWGDAVVGYIRIVEWIPQTAQAMEKALAEFASKGMTHLVLDVRSNPGGLLSSAVDVVDLFLDSGVIVSTRGRNPGENAEYKADPKLAVAKNVKIAVLINKGSASASEIFAGALKDTHRALLIGETSYGKGSVQQVFPLDDTGFKLTMARYYTPSGVNIDKTGIAPDLPAPVAEFSDTQLESFEKLLASGRIPAYAKEHPAATKEERTTFAKALIAEGFDLPESYVNRLIRDELHRTETAPIVDLEFDEQLNAALDVLGSTSFDDLLKSSRTLGEEKAAVPQTGAAAGVAPGAGATPAPAKP